MADNEKMAEQNDLKVLLQQWKESGLSVDEFCKKYLAENGVENPDEVLCRIDAQFERIETHYANIKKMKENGGTRAEYIEKVCSPVLDAVSVEKASDAIGALISDISGAEDLTVPFGNDEEKANAFEGLAEAIKANTLNILQEEYTVKEK